MDEDTLKRVLLILSTLVTAGAGIWFAYYQANKPSSPPIIIQQQIPSELLTKPLPAPPIHYEYFYVSPNSPRYYKLPPGYPHYYYNAPQYYFYYEPCQPYFVPGKSIYLGNSWWYTPNVGLINIGFYHPSTNPFPNDKNDNHRIIINKSNISSNATHIDFNKIKAIRDHVIPTPIPPPTPLLPPRKRYIPIVPTPRPPAMMPLLPMPHHCPDHHHR